jgi:hypothetical protein
MNLRYRAAGIAVLIAAACSLLAPSAALAAKAASIQAASYCIVTEAQSLRKPVPIFGNSSSCATWTPVSLPSGTGATSQLSFSPGEVASLPPGTHTLYLRFQDDQGVWGAPRRQRVKVVAPAAKTVSAAAFSIDGAADLDPANATQISAVDLTGKNGVQVPLDAKLLPGKHVLRLYLKDSSGFWGPARVYTLWVTARPTVKTGSFFVAPDPLPTPTTDPTTMGRSLGSFTTDSVTATGQFALPTPFDFGPHAVYAMFADSNGSWTKGWSDPAGTPELQSAFYVGNRLTFTATDSDGTHAGRDGSVQVASVQWPGTGYFTPALTCTSAGACSDVYPNGSVISLTAAPKGWIDKTPIWSGCTVMGDGTCQVTMDASKNVTLQFVDRVAPDTRVTVKPAAFVNLTYASFGFALGSTSVEDSIGVSYLCLLDGDPANEAGFTSCSSPRTFSGLAEGRHTFYVKAVDKALNRDATPASYSWTVDTTKPTVTTFTVPPTSNALSVSFSKLDATDTQGVTAYLVNEWSSTPTANDPGWSASVPSSYLFKTGGNKYLYAWARDAAGNVSASNFATVSVDIAPPTVTTFGLPSEWNDLTVPVTDFSASDDVGVTGYFLSEASEGPSASGGGWNATRPSSYRFTSAGDHTLYAFAKDASGKVSAAKSAKVSIVYTLTVSSSGTGSGSVNSAPAGIACSGGSFSGCSAKFPGGSVALMATPDAASTFEAWTGICSGAAPCSVTMDADKSVSAVFARAPLVKVGATPYATLQDAYDAAGNGEVIQMKDGALPGPLTANRAIKVKLGGGYQADYGSAPGTTTVGGTIRLRSGTVRVERVTVK